MVHCVPIDHCDKSCNEAPGFSCTEQLSNHRTTCLTSHSFVSAIGQMWKWYPLGFCQLYPHARQHILFSPYSCSLTYPQQKRRFYERLLSCTWTELFYFPAYVATWCPSAHYTATYSILCRISLCIHVCFLVFVWVTRPGITQESVNIYSIAVPER